mmetsp:Transcript_25770/g.55089  ORF Transcript_25770/g.55089 Transcript_25770/m.55089 type:complete len:105 (-) Transcript_25770:17-331(-)
MRIHQRRFHPSSLREARGLRDSKSVSISMARFPGTGRHATMPLPSLNVCNNRMEWNGGGNYCAVRLRRREGSRRHPTKRMPQVRTTYFIGVRKTNNECNTTRTI